MVVQLCENHSTAGGKKHYAGARGHAAQDFFKPTLTAVKHSESDFCNEDDELRTSMKRSVDNTERECRGVVVFFLDTARKERFLPLNRDWSHQRSGRQSSTCRVAAGGHSSNKSRPIWASRP